MIERDIERAIEACRPGSDDVSLPEMSHLAEAIRQDPSVREVYEHTQQADAAISGAFRDVSVPNGLADRLLEAVRAAEPDASSAQEPPTPSVRPAESHAVEDPGTHLRWRRRQWVRAAGAVAAISMTLLIAVFYLNRSNPEPVPGDRLRAEVSAWRDLAVRNGWQKDTASAALRNRPLNADIVATPRQWCQIETRYDSATIVYDLATPGTEFACIYCMHIRTSKSALPTTPPLIPHRPTGRLSIGVWRHGDMVYVLAVQGDRRRYGDFLNPAILFGAVTATPMPLS
jgi:hypothetical protein